MPKDDWTSTRQRAAVRRAREPQPGANAAHPSAMLGIACPLCHGGMRVRRNSQDGSRFLGCAAFPQCRGTRPGTEIVGEPVGRRKRSKKKRKPNPRRVACACGNTARNGSIQCGPCERGDAPLPSNRRRCLKCKGVIYGSFAPGDPDELCGRCEAD